MTAIQRAGRWYWVVVPRAIARLSRVAGVAGRDGMHLLVWPSFAAGAPVTAALLGIAAGLFRFGADAVFTESVVILALAVVLGFAGAQLGAWFVVAFGLADLLLHDHAVPGYSGGVPDALRLWAALALTYVALASVAVVAPLLVQAVRVQFRPPERLSPDGRIVAEVALAAVSAAVVIFVVLQSLPLLVRPVFTWQGRSPTTEAMFLVQGRTWLFALLAAGFAAVRVLSEYVAAVTDPTTFARVAEEPATGTGQGWWERRPAVVRVVVGALVGTWLLSGLLSTWWEALLTVLVLLAVEGLRRLVLPRRPAWGRMVESVPAVVRLLVALGLAVVLSAVVLPDRFTGESFLPLLLPVYLSLVLLAAAFPESRSPASPAEAS